MPETSCNTIDDNAVDAHVDETIKSCVLGKKSFFMFAGAGSGKTRSLVNALNFIAESYGKTLSLQQKQVAVITYTNAACDEISRRIGYNPLFVISTIHSFLWEIIKPYQRDIKAWVKRDLEEKISELQRKQSNPRRRKDYSGDIAKKQERLNAISKITRFTYDPGGENVGRDSLDHSEVIKMGSGFIHSRETMQKILVSRFPTLLIDESQDTRKELVDALLSVEEKHKGAFVIGMFGDVMQRIYMDGKDNLADSIPPDWEHPKKVMNHRSKERIVQVANAIRSDVDRIEQRPRSDKDGGFVRLFIVSDTREKESVETQIYSKMGELTGDDLWSESAQRKTLVLEHRMAATRLGFENIFDSLKDLGQSFHNGKLIELSFLMNVVYPLVLAKQEQNSFAVMKILRKHSPLLQKRTLQAAENQALLLQKVNKKVGSLAKLWLNDSIPTSLEIYKKLSEINLFELPKRIEEVLSNESEVSGRIVSLREGLSAPFTELERYWDYISDKTPFATHQGIKGLEFERVAVIMDDESSGGFLFKYNKLFGTEPLSSADRKNESEGKDTTLLRTLRLFYVTCTRAKEGLALIAYTNGTDAARATVLKNGWFSEDEVEIIQPS